jgi:hypothetical protein
MGMKWNNMQLGVEKRRKECRTGSVGACCCLLMVVVLCSGRSDVVQIDEVIISVYIRMILWVALATGDWRLAIGKWRVIRD